MATRKKRTIIEETLPESTTADTDGQPTDFDVSLESVEDTEALAAVLQQFGETNVSLKILRQTAHGSEFCYQTDILDEDFIQKNFGGGDYQVRVFIGGKYRKTIKIRIASRIANGTPNVPNNQSGNNDFLEKLVLALVAGNSAGGREAGPSITELTTALANLDNLRGKQESTMDLFLKGVNFAKETINSASDKPADWKMQAIEAVKDALPMLGGLIPNRQPNPAVQNALQHPENVPPQQQAELIKQGLVYLKKKCISNTDTGLIIDWIVANSEEYQTLIGMVLNTPFEKFVEIDAEIGLEPFKQWFVELFDGLRSAFVPAHTVDVDTPGSGGDHANVRDNGNVGKNPKPKG